MRRRYVASTSLRRHVPAANSAPLAPPPPQYSKPSYAYALLQCLINLQPVQPLRSFPFTVCTIAGGVIIQFFIIILTLYPASLDYQYMQTMILCTIIPFHGGFWLSWSVFVLLLFISVCAFWDITSDFSWLGA